MSMGGDLRQEAGSAKDDRLWEILRTVHPEVLEEAVTNRNLTEEMALFIAKNRNTPPHSLGFLASDIRFKKNYTLKLALCKNPKTPQRILLQLLKFINIFDLADMTRNPHLPVFVKQRIEYELIEKIPSMPSGNKTAIARRASSTVVVNLLERGDKAVINACLDSPTLTEAHLYMLILKQSVKPILPRMIAEHPKWSLRYAIRFNLIRNPDTPMVYSAKFIESMKTVDLRFLYADGRLPAVARPFIYRELLSRGESIEEPAEIQFRINEKTDSDLSDVLTYLDNERKHE